MKKGKIIITFLLISLTLIFTACNETTNAESDDSTGEV